MTLRHEGYIHRLVEPRIKALMKEVGAISIEGPKYCGKTWCAESLAASEYSLVDPAGNFQKRQMAAIDPLVALKGIEPHLIDEWQDVPAIWDAVRYTLDQSDSSGRFILCGSSTVDKGRISHSGAGRIVSIRMRPMTLYESGDSSGEISLRSLFNGGFRNAFADPCGLESLAHLVIRGGWPDLLGKDEAVIGSVLSDYLRKLCETDARKLDGRRIDSAKLMRTIRSLSRNESALASKAKIASDILEYEGERIDDETTAGYLDLLGRLFMIEDQPAFSPGYRSSLRVGKKPKRHLADPSLAAAALGLGSPALIEDLKTFGFLFEALCERDLDVYARCMGGSLYHYRDYSGNGIDAVVDVPGVGWGAFEIKLGQNAADQAAEGLLRIRDAMERNGASRLPSFLCVISGTGGMAYRREDGVYVVPIRMLGP